MTSYYWFISCPFWVAIYESSLRPWCGHNTSKKLSLEHWSWKWKTDGSHSWDWSSWGTTLDLYIFYSRCRKLILDRELVQSLIVITKTCLPVLQWWWCCIDKYGLTNYASYSPQMPWKNSRGTNWVALCHEPRQQGGTKIWKVEATKVGHPSTDARISQLRPSSWAPLVALLYHANPYEWHDDVLEMLKIMGLLKSAWEYSLMVSNCAREYCAWWQKEKLMFAC